MREIGTAPRDYICDRDRTGIRLERHKGARGLAPDRIGFGDHRRLHDLRVAVERVLDLERGDVFAARDDDVLRPVLDLDITVGMTNPEVAGMEPALCEGRLGRRRVLEISLHQGIPAQYQLTHRAAIPRDIGHRLRIDDALPIERLVGHTLTRHARRPVRQRQRGPRLLPGAHRGRTVAFRQSV